MAGQNVTETLLDYARSKNVTKILIGKTNQPRWKRFLVGTVVDEVLNRSGPIDVYVIHGEEEPIDAGLAAARTARRRWSPYARSALLSLLAAGLAYGLRRIHLADTEANTVMIFLAVVALSALREGRGPSILASAMSVLIFDYFFVPPLGTLAVADTQYVVTFVVMLTIGLVISTLASRLRAQVESTRQRERNATALYELGKQLSALYGDVFLVSAAGRKLADMLEGEVAVYLARQPGTVELAYGMATSIAGHPVSLPAAHWVIEHNQIAGAGTNTLPNAVALFIPLAGTQQVHGAIAARLPNKVGLYEPEARRLLESCANQLALALERDRLAIEAAESRIQAEAEQVRSTLLSSVSHDFKTPLAAITGASSSLLSSKAPDDTTSRQLLQTISDEAARLNRMLENILQMSRLEAGAAVPRKQWHVLEEVVGSALHRTSRELQNHHVSVRLPRDLPLAFVDGLLLEQVFVNLLENAARHTPEQTHVTITAAVDDNALRIAVADNGPGFPPGAEQKIFEKFYRGDPAGDRGRGSGLGLAICRAIIKAHGGQITAANRPGGGAEFIIRLPRPPESPSVIVE